MAVDVVVVCSSGLAVAVIREGEGGVVVRTLGFILALDISEFS